mmetsp:Transcript_26174/g.61055  ORF Transcript_26174/g.61055 Transcript_26174/m.61055 type:complete len:128 (+) Transcript_26174:61-444(+)
MPKHRRICCFYVPEPPSCKGAPKKAQSSPTSVFAVSPHRFLGTDGVEERCRALAPAFDLALALDFALALAEEPDGAATSSCGFSMESMRRCPTVLSTNMSLTSSSIWNSSAKALSTFSTPNRPPTST